MTASAARTAQVNTAKPGEPVERHLSSDQTFREWSHDSKPTGDDIKRIKVCRVETVCKMRYKEGQTPRTRVRNLVVPLRYEDETTPISEAFTKQVRQALDNLRDKQGVTVRFIGYTDDAPLTGRDESTYGNHLSLSKARAHRVALAMQEALGLPTSAIESDGRGASHPLASNETVQGRTLNRRVEVEFWYDDPLQELPDEPQLCPGRCRGNGDQGLRSPLGQHPDARARERPADHSARLRGEPASRADGHRGSDQRATAVHRLHEERAPRPPHRVRVRRRHRPFRGAGAPRHGHRHAGSAAVGRPVRARGTRLRPVRRRRERRLHPGRRVVRARAGRV